MFIDDGTSCESSSNKQIPGYCVSSSSTSYSTLQSNEIQRNHTDLLDAYYGPRCFSPESSLDGTSEASIGEWPFLDSGIIYLAEGVLYDSHCTFYYST